MPSSDSSDNVFGIGGPSEGLGLRIVLGEVAIDRRLEVDNADLLSKRDVKAASSSDARPTIVVLTRCVEFDEQSSQCPSGHVVGQWSQREPAMSSNHRARRDTPASSAGCS